MMNTEIEFDGKPPSPKCLNFILALKQLCKEHEVRLSTSGYDGMEIRDAKGFPGIWCAGIEDMTDET